MQSLILAPALNADRDLQEAGAGIQPYGLQLIPIRVGGVSVPTKDGAPCEKWKKPGRLQSRVAKSRTRLKRLSTHPTSWILEDWVKWDHAPSHGQPIRTCSDFSIMKYWPLMVWGLGLGILDRTRGGVAGLAPFWRYLESSRVEKSWPRYPPTPARLPPLQASHPRLQGNQVQRLSHQWLHRREKNCYFMPRITCVWPSWP